MAETLFSFAGTARQGRVALLNKVTRFVSNDVLQHNDVGAVGPANRVPVDVAVQLVAGPDRRQELQYLVDMHDLSVLDFDVVVLEERTLCAVAEDRDEGQRRQQRAVTQLGGGLLLEKGGV